MKNLGWDKVGPHKDAISERIKDNVRINHCCRVGYACYEILKDKYKDLDDKQPAEFNCLDKLAAQVCEDRGFIKEDANANFPYDWNIRKNPGNLRFFERAWVLALCSLFLSLIGSYVLDRSKSTPNNIQVRFQDSINKMLTQKTLVVQEKHDTLYLSDSLLKKLTPRK